MEIDEAVLERELDKTKGRTFLGKNAAFKGPLLCTLTFLWDDKIPTAATDGIRLWWNPQFFMSLLPQVRETVLMHELDHVALLHCLRRGERDPEIWNYACDIVINNDLDRDGYSFEGLKPWMDHQFDGMAAEEVYDILMKNNIKPPPQSGSFGPSDGEGDMKPLSSDEQQQAVGNVVQAVQAAKQAGQPGSIPGSLETVLDKFLRPKINWHKQLIKFFTDLDQHKFSWRKKNKRFREVRMPSRVPEEGRLSELNYYLDVSGSVTDEQVIRFNSEVKFIKDTYNPKMLRLVLFDTRIQKIYEFKEDDPFDKVVVVGRGGTSLREVREHIMATKPSAAIIFSDLECTPMEPIPNCPPTIWVAIDNKSATVPFGKLIHIKD